jgi:hypothetical protein
MQEYEFVMEDIDTVVGGLKTGIPHELAHRLNTQVVKVAEHFYTIADLLELQDPEVERFAEQLSTALLYKQIKDSWYKKEGMVFVREPSLWYAMAPSVSATRTWYEPDNIPPEWRRQLGMLQLLDRNRTCLKDCGYRHNDKVFFLLEAGHESDN